MNAKQLKEWEAEEAERRFVIDCCVEEFQKNLRRKHIGFNLPEEAIRIIVFETFNERKSS